MGLDSKHLHPALSAPLVTLTLKTQTLEQERRTISQLVHGGEAGLGLAGGVPGRHKALGGFVYVTFSQVNPLVLLGRLYLVLHHILLVQG